VLLDEAVDVGGVIHNGAADLHAPGALADMPPVAQRPDRAPQQPSDFGRREELRVTCVDPFGIG